ncbi:group II trans-sialidase superfamily [Trypanosoma rangeli]|uniref:Group II trans-sialidase superfamily n=1 Tax=Trypanosoma rangeli TaxID=5698 RepID=A0A422MYT4_TRYRA|nr:group II trans-sialidase superfamily [Trypanosoma rangeli]RNE98382.1 group II trans-sialidase superfamily [Trypanosoma rangeli]|eukprot:RNE98382.1 group II trans-sialidase superfamily [Trypanosoma rangeli]
MSEQRPMPMMYRHLFPYSVMLLLFVLMCFASTAAHAEESKPNEMQTPEPVSLLVPRQTIVETQGQSQTRKSFAYPSLTSAGGVLVVLAGSEVVCDFCDEDPSIICADIVGGYIDPAENWSSFVDEVRLHKWKAHSIINTATEHKNMSYMIRTSKPTTIAKGNNVFLLVGDYHQKYDPSCEEPFKISKDLVLLVGESTQDKVIQWGKPTSLLPQIEQSAKQRGLKEFIGGGGSGVVMEDGTFVFPVTAMRTEENETVSTIIYSKDDGKNWVLSQGMLPAGCTDPLIIEWEQGQLLMAAKYNSLSKVFESRDMGATWTEAVRTLTRVHPRFLPKTLQMTLSVASLTTATIAGKKVMLYTQKGIPPGDTVQATALYLWVADNNRTFHVGPISVDIAGTWTSGNTLLHSNNALHFLEERSDFMETRFFLSPLTDALKTTTSILENWAELDSFLSNSSVPTAGLVGFLSDASGDGTWNDAYRCVNSIVTDAEKVENGFKFTGSESYAMWPVNMWTHHNVHGFVDYAFTLVATVTIDEVPNESVPLLGAGLNDKENTTFVGLSYTTEKRWGTVFDGITTTTHHSTWEPGKEYKVALMLQDNEGSVYVDGVLVGNTNKLPTLEARTHDISHFYFGGGEKSSVTVKNVFLYNRPLSEDELMAVDSSDSSEKRAGDGSDSSEKRAGDGSDASEKRAGDGSGASEKRAGDGSGASEKRAGDGSDASEQLAGDRSTRADVSRLLLLLLGLWGVAALC